MPLFLGGGTLKGGWLTSHEYVFFIRMTGLPCDAAQWLVCFVFEGFKNTGALSSNFWKHSSQISLKQLFLLTSSLFVVLPLKKK